MRFTLREGVKFHDSSVMNADDVVYSLNRAMARDINFTLHPKGSPKW